MCNVLFRIHRCIWRGQSAILCLEYSVLGSLVQVVLVKIACRVYWSWVFAEGARDVLAPPLPLLLLLCGLTKIVRLLRAVVTGENRVLRGFSCVPLQLLHLCLCVMGASLRGRNRALC